MHYSINIHNGIGSVKSGGWSAMREQVISFVRLVMETVLQAEQEEQMGCQRYERSKLRHNYANGSYKRTLSTSHGVIPGITIPRLRKGSFVSQLLTKYRRRVEEVDRSLLSWYLQGESCRDVVRSMQVWTQDVLSAQTVSRLIQTIDARLRQWRQRPLPHDLVAVWLDGFWIKVRVKHKVRSYVILAALGRHKDGRWEVLSFRLAESESELRWKELLHQMHARGMRTALFIHDGAGGIQEALRWDYPGVKTQRCLVHKLRNILEMVTEEKHRTLIQHDFWSIYDTSDTEEARARFGSFCRRWIRSEPQAVFTARRGWQSTVTFLELADDAVRTLCRSTNIMEFLYRELRRRVKVIGAFPTPQSAERIIFGTLLYIENVNLNKSGNMPSLLQQFTHN